MAASRRWFDPDREVYWPDGTAEMTFAQAADCLRRMNDVARAQIRPEVDLRCGRCGGPADRHGYVEVSVFGGDVVRRLAAKRCLDLACEQRHTDAERRRAEVAAYERRLRELDREYGTGRHLARADLEWLARYARPWET